MATFKKMIRSCRDATALMEKKHREPLLFAERLHLLVHKAVCAACRRYDRQSALLERIFTARQKGVTRQDIDSQTVELEEKILRELDRQDR